MEYKVTKTDFFKTKIGTTKVVSEKAQEVKTVEPTTTELIKAEPVKSPTNRPIREKIPQKISCVMREASELFLENDMKTLALGIEQIKKEEKKEHFTVAVVGEFSRGKSTFVNKILGKEIFPVSNLPTTAMLTRIRFNKEDMIAVFNDKGERVRATPLSEDAWDGLTADNFNGRDPKGVVMVGVKNTWLQENCLEIIDTPGAGDLEESRARVIGDALLGSDGAIITISATAPLSESEQLFIEQRLIAKKIPFLMIIITKLDLIHPNERSNVLNYIKNRLSLSKAGNIPIFVPYTMEMPDRIHDDIIGMDKVKEEIMSWMYHPERTKIVTQWMVARMDNLFETARDTLKEQLHLMDADKSERAEIILNKKKAISQAEDVWEDLKVEMQARYLECYKLFKGKVLEYTNSIVERLQYESKRSNSPQKWWQEDYPYRVKIELTNMAAGMENAISGRVTEDINWLARMLNVKFKSRIMLEKQTIMKRDMFIDCTDVDEEVEIDDLTKKKEIIRVSTTALGVLGKIALRLIGSDILTIVATAGISTGASMISDKFFKGKIEEQQQLIQNKIVENIPKVINESTARSEQRLKDVYDEIINEATAEEKKWLQTQNDMVEKTVNGESIQKKENILSLMEQITELQNKLHS